MRPIVTIADTAAGLPAAFDAIFAPYGGIAKVIPSGSKVHIKPNGVHFAAGAYTDPAVLDALLTYLIDHGYNRLALMENCTQGVATRLVFEVNGYADIARQHGAELVYLDEGGTVPYTLEGEEVPIRISRRLYESFIDPSRHPGNFYLSLPKLKTHSMTTMTLGVKNQQAFPIDEDRMHFHGHETLHPRLARLYRMVQPDFCIIEGVTAIFNGHIPPTALLRESSVQLNVLIGGQDTVAVDTVGCKVMGYAIEEVEHLRLAAEWGLGEGQLDNIEVIGNLSRFRKRYPYALLRRFHTDVRIVEGREQACVEGCKGNTECVLELLSNDYPGQGGFTIVFGKGFDDADLEDLPGDILMVGSCTINDRGTDLRQRYRDRRIIEVEASNDVRGITAGVATLMKIRPLDMVPLSPIRSLWITLQAKLHGLNSRMPPLLGGPKSTGLSEAERRWYREGGGDCGRRDGTS
ncbi:MAG: DUF362 domain-containing protein [Dehalococcoidia bacterium]|nr:MAG: DUF362 domain-containing protein [Dehalococcoidia bacterium]